MADIQPPATPDAIDAIPIPAAILVPVLSHFDQDMLVSQVFKLEECF
jgi:hypothetical protein